MFTRVHVWKPLTPRAQTSGWPELHLHYSSWATSEVDAICRPHFPPALSHMAAHLFDTAVSKTGVFGCCIYLHTTHRHVLASTYPVYIYHMRSSINRFTLKDTHYQHWHVERCIWWLQRSSEPARTCAPLTEHIRLVPASRLVRYANAQRHAHASVVRYDGNAWRVGITVGGGLGVGRAL